MSYRQILHYKEICGALLLNLLVDFYQKPTLSKENPEPSPHGILDKTPNS